MTNIHTTTQHQHPGTETFGPVYVLATNSLEYLARQHNPTNSPENCGDPAPPASLMHLSSLMILKAIAIGGADSSNQIPNINGSGLQLLRTAAILNNTALGLEVSEREFGYAFAAVRNVKAATANTPA